MEDKKPHTAGTDTFPAGTACPGRTDVPEPASGRAATCTPSSPAGPSSGSEREGWYVVTGANAGMGRTLAEELAFAGKRVVMACRSMERSMPVRDEIATATENPDIRLLPLDLSSFGSILAFAGRLESDGIAVKTLINNAGVMNGEFRTTADGLEQTIGVNYTGTWLLTRLLLHRMGPGSRIVNTLSCTWRIGRLGRDPLRPKAENYSRFGAYSRSKLALLLFTLELADRMKEHGIGVWGADPGVVSTGMITMGRWFDPLADLLFRPLIRTPRQGADTSLWLALGGAAPEGAVYYAGRRPKRLPRRVTGSPCRRTLWEETERLVREKTGLEEI